MDKTVTINDVQLDFPALNIDFLKKFDTAEQKMIESLASSGDGSTSGIETFERQGDIMTEFFDETFGEGTAAMLFISRDLGDYLEAYKAIKVSFDVQISGLTGLLGEILRP